MQDQSTSSLVSVTALAVILSALMLCGCRSTEQAKQRVVIESKSPDVWASQPVQEVSFRIELTR